ncbi:MAG: DUF975 family protein, partial [Clostridia bacterium]|nr:DUF975 family protein [Clostridia bacterium]
MMSTAKEMRDRAWNSLKGKYWIAVAASFVVGILTSVGANVSNLDSFLAEMVNTLNNGDWSETRGYLLVLGVGLLFTAGGFLLATLVNGPATVGGCSYFIKNTNGAPEFIEIFSGFRTNYKRNVITMLLVNIKLYLWMLLFIVPGIIKSFEYAVIPYILADNPDISTREAFQKAKAMMKGKKWDLFELS